MFFVFCGCTHGGDNNTVRVDRERGDIFLPFGGQFNRTLSSSLMSGSFDGLIFSF